MCTESCEVGLMVMQPRNTIMLMIQDHQSLLTVQLLGHVLVDSNNDGKRQSTTVVVLFYLLAQLLDPAADFLLLLDLYLYFLHLPNGLHHLLLNLQSKAIGCSLFVQHNITFFIATTVSLLLTAAPSLHS